MITGKNILRHELIGLGVQVVRSTDPSLAGVSGTVVDETKNSFVLARTTDGKRLRIGKAGCAFSFSLPGGGCAQVDGNNIAFKPEDRVKKCR